ATQGTSAAGPRLVLQEHARLAEEPLARAARAHAPDDPRPQPRAEGTHGGRRARLRGVPAPVPRARREREGLGRPVAPVGAGHGRDALAVAEHVAGHALATRGAARDGLRRTRSE